MNKVLSLWLFISFLLTSCVTQTVNSDGSVANQVVDKVKLSETYANLAVEYKDRNALAVALDRADLAVNTDSSNSHAYLVRAIIYESLGRKKEANSDYLEAIDLKADYSEAHIYYGHFLCDNGQYLEANNHFLQALNDPTYITPSFIYYNQGLCDLTQNLLTSAKTNFIKTIAYRDFPINTYYYLALVFYRLKEYELARLYISKYYGDQTSKSLWLNIEILQALINTAANSKKVREYTAFRKTLGVLLVKNYAGSYEATLYIKDYGG